MAYSLMSNRLAGGFSIPIMRKHFQTKTKRFIGLFVLVSFVFSQTPPALALRVAQPESPQARRPIEAGLESVGQKGLRPYDRQEAIRVIRDGIFGKNAAVWEAAVPGQGENIVKWMGWLHAADQYANAVDEIEGRRKQFLTTPAANLILNGTGGSLWGAMTLYQLLEHQRKPGAPSLVGIDLTDPGALHQLEGLLQDPTTKLIIASKSAINPDTNALEAYLRQRIPDPARIVGITDPDKKINGREEDAFHYVFRNDPEIGGRYSVLSFFGLVPAAFAGIDVRPVLQSAQEAKKRLETEPERAEFILSVIELLHKHLSQRRDKWIMRFSPQLRPLAPWLQQLFNEDNAKVEHAPVVITDEPDLGEAYPDPGDRLIIRITTASPGSPSQAREIPGKIPTISIELQEPTKNIGGYLFEFEIIASVLGYFIGVHPFNQPQVEASKSYAFKAVERALQFPEDVDLVSQTDGARVYFNLKAKSIGRNVSAFLGASDPKEWISFLAYTYDDAALREAIHDIRMDILTKLGNATHFGIGTRYQHSDLVALAGKGGAFVIFLTFDSAGEDPFIPGKSIRFSEFTRMQALGNYQSLTERGLPAIWIHLPAEYRRDPSRIQREFFSHIPERKVAAGLEGTGEVVLQRIAKQLRLPGRITGNTLVRIVSQDFKGLPDLKKNALTRSIGQVFIDAGVGFEQVEKAEFGTEESLGHIQVAGRIVNSPLDLTLEWKTEQGALRLIGVRFDGGGGSVNTAKTIANQGQYFGLISPVGDDPIDQAWRRSFANPHIVPFFVPVPGFYRRINVHHRIDGASIGYMAGPGQRIPIETKEGLNQAFESLASRAPNLKWFVMTAGERMLFDDTPGLFRSWVEAAHRRNLQVLIDFNVTSTLDEMKAVVDLPRNTRRDILAPNEAELEKMGLDPAELLKRNVQGVLIKKGDRGLTLFLPGQVISKPAIPVTPVGPAGAGDTTNAGFILALAEGLDWEKALEQANLFGAATVSLPGTLVATPQSIEALKGKRAGLESAFQKRDQSSRQAGLESAQPKKPPAPQPQRWKESNGVLIRQVPVESLDSKYSVKIAEDLQDRVLLGPGLKLYYGKEVPIFLLPSASRVLGRPVYIRREPSVFQEVRSSKPRMLAALFDYYLYNDPHNLTGYRDQYPPSTVPVWSTGNHGQAVAWWRHVLLELKGMRSWYFKTLPEVKVYASRKVPANKQNRIQDIGATLLADFDDYGQAKSAVLEEARMNPSTVLPWPHGSRAIIMGNMTSTVEFQRRMETDRSFAFLKEGPIGVVVASAAGGRGAGLSGGYSQLMGGRVEVIAAETDRTRPVYEAIKRGRSVSMRRRAVAVEEDGIDVDRMEEEARRVFDKTGYAVVIVPWQDQFGYTHWVMNDLQAQGLSRLESETETVTGVSLAALMKLAREHPEKLKRFRAFFIEETGQNIEHLLMGRLDDASLPELVRRTTPLLATAGLEAPNPTFIDTADVQELDAMGKATDLDKEQRKNLLAVLSHLGVKPSTLVLNVGSGGNPLYGFPPEWERPLNIDGRPQADYPAQNMGARYLQVTMRGFIERYLPPQGDLAPGVVFLHRMGSFIHAYHKDHVPEFWKEAWSIVPPEGWLLLMNSPTLPDPVSLEAMYAEFNGAVDGKSVAEIRVISPSQGWKGALVVAIRRSAAESVQSERVASIASQPPLILPVTVGSPGAVSEPATAGLETNQQILQAVDQRAWTHLQLFAQRMRELGISWADPVRIAAVWADVDATLTQPEVEGNRIRSRLAESYAWIMHQEGTGGLITAAPYSATDIVSGAHFPASIDQRVIDVIRNVLLDPADIVHLRALVRSGGYDVQFTPGGQEQITPAEISFTENDKLKISRKLGMAVLDAIAREKGAEVAQAKRYLQEARDVLQIARVMNNVQSPLRLVRFADFNPLEIDSTFVFVAFKDGQLDSERILDEAIAAIGSHTEKGHRIDFIRGPFYVAASLLEKSDTLAKHLRAKPPAPGFLLVMGDGPKDDLKMMRQAMELPHLVVPIYVGPRNELQTEDTVVVPREATFVDASEQILMAMVEAAKEGKSYLDFPLIRGEFTVRQLAAALGFPADSPEQFVDAISSWDFETFQHERTSRQAGLEGGDRGTRGAGGRPENAHSEEYRLHEEAVRLWREGDLEGALVSAEKALKINSKNPFVLVTKAGILNEKKEYMLAVETADHAIRVAPQNSQAYERRAEAYVGLKRFSEALEDASEAIRLDPDPSRSRGYTLRADAYLGRAEVSKDLTYFHKAIEDASEAILRYPQGSQGYYLRAKAYLELGQFKKALPDAEKFLERNAGYRGEELFSRVLIGLGRYEEAIRHATNSIRLHPQAVPAYINRLKARVALGRSDAALEDAQSIVRFERDPRSAIPLKLLGLVHLARGDAGAGQGALQSAAALDPKDEGVQFCLGVSWLMKGEFEKARRSFEGTMALDPQHPAWRYLRLNWESLSEAQRDSLVNILVDFAVRRSLGLGHHLRFPGVLETAAGLEQTVFPQPQPVPAGAPRWGDLPLWSGQAIPEPSERGYVLTQFMLGNSPQRQPSLRIWYEVSDLQVPASLRDTEGRRPYESYGLLSGRYLDDPAVPAALRDNLRKIISSEAALLQIRCPESGENRSRGQVMQRGMIPINVWVERRQVFGETARETTQVLRVKFETPLSASAPRDHSFEGALTLPGGGQFRLPRGWVRLVRWESVNSGWFPVAVKQGLLADDHRIQILLFHGAATSPVGRIDVSPGDVVSEMIRRALGQHRQGQQTVMWGDIGVKAGAGQSGADILFLTERSGLLPLGDVISATDWKRRRADGILIGTRPNFQSATFVIEAGPETPEGPIAEAADFLLRELQQGKEGEGFSDFHLRFSVEPDGVRRLFIAPVNSGRMNPEGKVLAPENYWAVGDGLSKLRNAEELWRYDYGTLSTDQPPSVETGRPILDRTMDALARDGLFLFDDGRHLDRTRFYDDPHLPARIEKVLELDGVPSNDPRIEAVVKRISVGEEPSPIDKTQEEILASLGSFLKRLDDPDPGNRFNAVWEWVDAISRWRSRHERAYRDLPDEKRSELSLKLDGALRQLAQELPLQVRWKDVPLPEPDLSSVPEVTVVVAAMGLNITDDIHLEQVVEDGRRILQVEFQPGGGPAHIAQAIHQQGGVAYLFEPEGRPRRKSIIVRRGEESRYRAEVRLMVDGEPVTPEAVRALSQRIRQMLGSRPYMVLHGERLAGSQADQQSAARALAESTRDFQGEGHPVYVKVHPSWSSEVAETILAAGPQGVFLLLESLAQLEGGSPTQLRQDMDRTGFLAHRLLVDWKIPEWVLIPLEAGGVVMAGENGATYGSPWPLLELTYTMGAADTTMATFLHTLSRGSSFDEAVGAAVAAGSILRGRDPAGRGISPTTGEILEARQAGVSALPLPREAARELYLMREAKLDAREPPEETSARQPVRRVTDRLAPGLLSTPVRQLRGLPPEQTARAGLEARIAGRFKMMLEARQEQGGVLVAPAHLVDQVGGLRELLERLPEPLASSVVLWGDDPEVDELWNVNPTLLRFPGEDLAGLSRYLREELGARRVSVLGEADVALALNELLRPYGVPVQFVSRDLTLILETFGIPEPVSTQAGLEHLMEDLFTRRGA